MADTQTTNLNLTKPEPGAAEDTWGISLNADLDTLDAIFSSSGTQVNLNPNQINFADNKKAIFGAGSDLEIYHSGTHSIINETGTGELKIQATNLRLQSASGGENYLTADLNGAVRVYYDDTQKLQTTSTGIDVTGTASADILQSKNGKIFLDDNGTHNGIINAPASLFINFDSDNTSASEKIVFGYDRDSTTGGTTVMELDSSGIDVTGTVTATGTSVFASLDISGDIDVDGTTNLDVVDIDGAVSFGATASFADGVGAYFGDSSDLRIYHDGSDSYIAETGAGDLNISGGNDLRLRTPDGENGVKVKQNGEVQLYHDGSEKLETTSTGIDVTGTVTSDGLTLGSNHRIQGTGILFVGGSAATAFEVGAGSEEMRLTSTGLGIGTSSIDAKLHVESSSDTFLKVEKTGADNLNLIATGAGSRVRGSGDLIFDTGGGNERARIDSSGRLGIGTTSVGALLHISSGTTNNIANDVSEVRFIGTDKPLTGEHANLVIQTNDDMAANKGGSIGFGGRHTTSSTNGANFAHISGRKENATSANFAGYLSFGTSDSVSDIHERMRISSSGNLLVGTTSANFSISSQVMDGFGVSGDSGFVTIGVDSTYCLALQRNGSDGVIQYFFNGTANAGNISISGSSTSYNTSSDARLKDVTGEARGLEVINELNPVSYNWKESGQADEGLIAQEVMDIVPNAVTGSEEEMYSMDYSKLVVHLVKGMKEQQTQIEALQSEINNLKGE